MEVAPVAEPHDDKGLPVPRALGLPDHHANEAAVIARSHDAREPLPQVDRAAPAELRLVGEHPIREVGACPLARDGDAARPGLTGQPALEGFPSAVAHDAPPRIAASAAGWQAGHTQPAAGSAP